MDTITIIFITNLAAFIVACVVETIRGSFMPSYIVNAWGLLVVLSIPAFAFYALLMAQYGGLYGS